MILVLAFILNLIFIAHNIYKYVFGLRMKQTLIVTFYILIFVGTLCRIAEFCARAFHPEHGFYPKEDTFILYINSFALTLMICVELTLILTMHRLQLGLKLITGKITHQEVKRKECVAWLITAAFLFIYLVGETSVQYLTLVDKDPEWSPFWRIFVFLVLTVMYTAAMAMLNKVMHQMVGDFKTEIRSVNCQLIVFLLSYTTRCIWNLAFASDRLVAQLGPYTFNLIYLVVVIIWQVVPTFTVVVLHHSAFKGRREAATPTQDECNESINMIKTDNFQFLTETNSTQQL